METIKTALVVVLLLTVLYGVYVVLNKPVDPLPPEIAWHNEQLSGPLQVDLGDEFSAPQVELPANPGPVAEINSDAVAVERRTVAAAAMAEDAAVSPAQSAFVLEQPQPVEPPTAERSPAAAAVSDDAGRLADGGSKSTTLPLAGNSIYSRDAAASPVSAAAATSAAATSADKPLANSDLADEPPGAAVAQSGFSEDSIEGGPDVEAAAANEELSVTEPASSSSLSGTAPSSPGPTRFSPFQNALQSAMTKIDEQQWYDALWTLSLFFNSPDLTAEQQQQLLDWLDPLAAKVIYSTEHLIEPAYEVQRGETLHEIAERYSVPWQLLANINGIANADLLTAGQKLKVVRGPFRAEVDLARNELTVFAGKLYAGRFPITIGTDPVPQPGEYAVQDKQAGRTYYAGSGETIPSGDPANPFGAVWLDLGNDVSIHGSPEEGDAGSSGCISLSPLDAHDLFGILSQGSTVTIRR